MHVLLELTFSIYYIEIKKKLKDNEERMNKY